MAIFLQGRLHWMEDYKYLFKVVLVGNAGVGKTCLVRKFTQGIFPPGQSATIGVDFMIKTVKVGNDKIKLQIWDTAGQERFRSITQSYYRSAHAIVLVYDVACQPSFDCLPEWLGEIESYANRRVLKILVGNKVDKGEEREVPERIGRDFSEMNNFDYFLETSALDATNVDQLFEQVATRLTNDMKVTDERLTQYRADTSANTPNGGAIKLMDRAQSVYNMHRLEIRNAIRMYSKANQPASAKITPSHHTQYMHAKTGGFSQAAPTLHNPYKDDPILDRALRRMLPQECYEKVASDLARFGDRVVSEIEQLGRQAELEQPKLEQQDAWGKRIDKLVVCKEWYRLKQICAEEGIIAIGYEKDQDPYVQRLHQISKLFLFAPSAGLVTCPMAMTDGAVKTLTALNLNGKHKLATEAIERLQSRDPKRAWTSGQWMTEKKGGSDVAGGCDTYAINIEGDKYRLHGYKWFSSAVDADIALTLARVVDADGNAVAGSRGLSLFLLRIRDDDGNLNGIQMVRLKNKLGTKQLPTAELLLDGVIAYKIGEQGRGVAGISNMLNITRIHNSVASLGFMRRIISLARDYATKRIVFGQPQAKWPLHTSTIAKMEVDVRGTMLLLLESARLLGLSEAGKCTDVEALLLRLITPVLKLYAGKQAVPLVSEGIECFGGQGYMEDTGLPTLLRDAQVTPIWEGTTNVLSLDVLRVFSGRDNVLQAFGKRVEQLLQNAKTDNEKLNKSKEEIRKALKTLQTLLIKASDSALNDSVRIDSVARDISFAIARIYAGSLLIEFASDEGIANATDAEVAYRWCCEQPLVNLRWEWFSNDRVKADRNIVYESFAGKQSKL
ncbi:unnamed protein product [Caenorhabditis bovis]|uniref:Ras-related protein Rab-30 n=1 Tax=Caenorhabditis bovis TaxID=2654633 RepID=A0A8S1ENW1_9PELO|nr:unnamed protein product [Caenorhabditis bovis]